MKTIFTLIGILWTVLSTAQNSILPKIWQEGHLGAIKALAISPDNKTILSGGVDGTIIVWDTKTGNQLQRFTSTDGAIQSLLFSPDSKVFESLSTSGKLYYRTVANGNIIKETQVVVAPTEQSFYPLSTRNVGKELWEATYSNTIGNDSLVSNNIGLSQEYVAYIGKKYKLSLWDIKRKKQYTKLKAVDKATKFLVISPNGRYIATSGENANLKIWDIKKRKLIDSIPLVNQKINSIKFTSDSKKLNVIQEINSTKTANYHEYIDNTESLFTMRYFARHKTLLADTGSLILDYNSHTKLLASMQTDMNNNVLLLCDINDQMKHLLHFDTENIISTAFAANGRYVAIGGEYGSLSVFDVKKKDWLFKFQTPSAQINSITMSTDGKFMAVCFKGIDVATINNNRKQRIDYIVKKKLGDKVLLWSVDSSAYLKEIRTADAKIKSIAFTNQKLTLTDEYYNCYTLDKNDFSSSNDATIKALPLCDILQLEQNKDNDLIFSPNELFLIKKENNSTYRLRNIHERKELISLSNMASTPFFSANCKWLITVTNTGEVSKINTSSPETKILLATIPNIKSISLSESQKYVVAKCDDKIAYFALEQTQQPKILHTSGATDFCFKNNDTICCTAHSDSIFVYDTASSNLLYCLPTTDCKNIESICITPEGDKIFTSDGRTVKITTPKEMLKQEIFTTSKGEALIRNIENTTQKKDKTE